MIRGTKYLRNSRHLNKFLFTLTGELFYEPFESRYRPSSEYVDLVTALASDSPREWEIEREGIWIHVNPRNASLDGTRRPIALPVQGWKVHVSATLSNDISVLKKAAAVAFSNDVSFKFALDRNLLSLTSSKAWPRARSGKFITMYPPDLESFERLLEDLYRELRDEEGPYVLSDKRYKDCRVLYYRYGGIQRTTRLDMTGQKVLVLISPDGEAIPDVRSPYFDPPPWVSDPFPGESSSQSEIALNGGRYLVDSALSFSNSGGVYLAHDRSAGVDVVIKEARPHTLMDGPGKDAVRLLKKEEAILETLRDTGVAAAPLDSFQEWENFFLVQEKVEGLDLREVTLAHSPLMKAEPSLEDSITYYEIFRAIFTSFAERLGLLHERGIVFGDLSQNNVKTDPSTWAVRFIDFEGAFRVGVDEPTFLYTPGFKSEASIRKDAQGFEEDLYALAAIMLYMIFPIAALGSLRSDLFGRVLETMLADLGWARTGLFEVISGLAKNEVTCARAVELLAPRAEIAAPHYEYDIETYPGDDALAGLGGFILANMRPDGKEGLFPADPFVHQTNDLSLGFGACGVLYALRECGFAIPQVAYDWLERRLDDTKPGDLPPGLLTGASGIAWCLWTLGLEDRARELMQMANESPLVRRHHSYLYGMAGLGMANLYFHLRTGRDDHLSMARELAGELASTARESDSGIYWEDSEVVQVGFGYGQSGVALFFLRLFELTGDEELLATGRRALEFDLSHGVETETGGVSFPCAPGDPTLLPYVEEGSAGVAKVAMRYGLWDRTEPILCNVHRKYASFAGLLYGLASFVDVLVDASLLSGEERFLEMAKRPVRGVRDLYLIEQPAGLATPGDGLFRISCDYATGVAGVLRALHRFRHAEQADFVLDEIASKAGGIGEARPGDERLAMSG